MRIRSLTAFDVPIRLKQSVRHASHERSNNDTLIIRCELDDGSIGWGEGLPRPYVTGETIETAWKQVEKSDWTQIADADLRDFESVHTAIGRLHLHNVADETHQPWIERDCFGNSVRCAIELAVLDAFGKSSGQTVGDLLHSLPEMNDIGQRVDSVRYSGVVTSVSGFKQWRSGLKMKLFGFQQVKIKVGTEGVNDEQFVRRIRRVVGRSVDLRLDVNEAWQPSEVAPKLKPLLPLGISSVEQPVPHESVNDLAAVSRGLCIPIMLDESLCSMKDAERSQASQTCDAFNLRISKCGGLINCVKLADFARRHDLTYQLGCQVGETGILSAAGRHFACNVAGIRYLEGSYDRFLVNDRLTIEDMTFGFGGQAPRITKPGLGITVDEASVRQNARRSLELI